MRSPHQSTTILCIEVPEPLRGYIAPAVTRLAYLYPTVAFVIRDSVIEAKTTNHLSETLLRREVYYALYREKIFADTLDLRRALVEAVTR